MSSVSVSSVSVSADDLMPLLVYALVHANIPNINKVLWSVRQFALDDGELECVVY